MIRPISDASTQKETGSPQPQTPGGEIMTATYKNRGAFSQDNWPDANIWSVQRLSTD
ncbi:MAG: hypothetical protein ACYSVY_07270 [Planctomycetota bacterium]